MRKIIVGIVMFLGLISNCYAKDLPETIRIGLSYGSRAVNSFTVFAPSGVMISDIGKVKGKVTIEKDSTNKVKIKSGSNSKRCTVDKEYGLSIIPVEEDEFLSYNGKEYRGALVVFRLSGSDMTVINALDLEEYLYGVVPKELSPSNPIEALKAQAVAARTYTCTQLGKYEKWNFDLTYTTADQAYGGVDVEHESSTSAVDKTRGEIVTYNGQPISTYYFATSPGYTENSENVWNSKLPYLVAVEDKYQSKTVSTLNWTVDFTLKQLESILANKSKKIGDLLSVNILKKSPSGGVLELEFKGTKDSYVVEKEATRFVYGTSDVKSQFYDIENDAMVSVMNIDGDIVSKPISSLKIASEKKPVSLSSKLKEIVLKGKEKDVERSLVPTKIILKGKGWGHGVGMSQNGAIGMAKEGFKYDEILKYYYTGTEIEEF